jgi:hypothetical protein
VTHPRRSRLGTLFFSVASVGVAALVTFGLPPFVAAWIPAAERTLSLKLPIEGAHFHWTFLEPEAFLARAHAPHHQHRSRHDDRDRAGWRDRGWLDAAR